MQIKNLKPLDVKVIEEQLKKLQQHNPDIIYKVFPMEELRKDKQQNKMLQEISDKLDAVLHELHNTFGNYVLINGAWKDLNLNAD